MEVFETLRWEDAEPLSAQESSELDRLAAASGVPVQDLMECAGWQAARWIAAVSGDPYPQERRIGIVVGLGNNGGDGLVAARHLADWGYAVDVICTGAEERMRELPHGHLLRARRAGIPIAISIPSREVLASTYGGGVLVDAILGTGSVLPLREEVATACRMLNTVHARRLAIDVPTGVDATTGEADGDAFQPDATLCLAATKKGFRSPDAWGDVYVADLPIPRSAWQELGKPRSVDRGRIVRIACPNDA